MKKQIKLFAPSVGKDEEIAVKQTLQSHFWASGAGTGKVSQFEKKFKKYVKSKEAVAVNSGTSALNLALSLLNVKNKEIILPSLSFVSTANAVLLNGAKPVFVDVDPINLCIDPEHIKKSITKKTKVILPVHFGGMPCDLNKITELCKENKLTLVEDAAHAAGASYKNQKIGSHGQAVCFSFHPVKNLAMPTGGLISINHKNYKKIRKTLLSRRWCGITNRKDAFYDVQELGWNYYMNEFSAAIGLIQLQKLDKMNNYRRKIAHEYDKKINLENKIPYSKECSYHLYWICVKNRESFRKKLKNVGIETGIHYKPIHTMSLYNFRKKLVNTERISKQIVSIPMHPNLSKGDVEKIIFYVNKFL